MKGYEFKYTQVCLLASFSFSSRSSIEFHLCLTVSVSKKVTYQNGDELFFNFLRAMVLRQSEKRFYFAELLRIFYFFAADTV